MKRTISIFWIVIIFFFVSIHSVFAQENPQDNLALFSQLQEALAGKANSWQFRHVDEANNNTFVTIPYTPEMVLQQEDKARNRPDTFRTEASDIGTGFKMGIMKSITNPDSWKGALFRTMIASGDQKENFFNGDYIIPTTGKTEIEKIREIYNHITNTVKRYDVPTGDVAAYCLTQGAGVCRHMATVLNESLKKAGITSEVIQSPTHAWVRVSMSDPDYKGISFDLDPTWYQQAIPLPPRSKEPLTQEWARKMLAIATAPSGGINLNGFWTDSEASNLIGKQAGKSFSLAGRKTGRITFVGTVSENSVSGQKLLFSDECPNLDRYVPSKGTISEDGKTISLDHSNFKYYIDDCTIVPDSEFPDPIVFTKVEENQTASPSATQQ